ncbi:MAG: LLM class F420-dependent oxidoreductase [Candidatus Lambdaproteobacteria bacterium]|nr:LLM class F420-dependent oxidoreductase [Candidatus Lambdaproteobacteria bacterium]
MRLALQLDSTSPHPSVDVALVQEAERLGYGVVWTSEAYGADAVTRLAWIGALTSKIMLGTSIMQIPGRSPANTAMTAITLDALSDGRLILGLGTSGPQVAEGWHGVRFGKPLGVTREYITIVRKILARKEPVSFQGKFFRLPYDGPDATGLGKPLRSTSHGRADLPIYLAAIGPKNLELAGEIADGVIPYLVSPEHIDVLTRPLQAGFAKAGGGKDFSRFDLVVGVPVVPGDDVQACRDKCKPAIALYVGGMGARKQNFYNANMRRCGYEEAAEKIQNLYLDGKKDLATAAVPDTYVDEVALCGPKARIRDRFQRYKKIPVGTLTLRRPELATVRLMAEIAL